jgi:DNA repair exonuclease SbcCD ATPase subunit
MHREALQARRAKAKSQNTEVPPDGPTQEDEAVDTLAKEVKGLDKKYSDLRTKQAILTTEINTIDSEIKSIQNSISSINAQKNPDAALGEAKKNTEQAQQRLNGASTPKEHKEAQQQLTAAQEKEQEIQSISDDSKKAVDNIMTEQEPKYLQLRAEMQTMEMGTRLLDYMITSMTTKASTPSVVGSASPNPAYMTLDNNINYGLMYFILYTCKASSIRFLALAQEIGYEPTSEMSIIASITEYETKMAGFGAMAPGSVQLNV